MPELDVHIKRIDGKLKQLIRQYQQSKAENAQLIKQVRENSVKEIELRTQIQDLEQKVQILKAATGQMDAKDKLALEKNINKHLKEIDRCITFLSE